MKLFSLVVTALLIGALPFGAMAASKKPILDSSESVEPDKGDGCGLGWQVTQKRTMIATTTRATTNGFVPPTFGMTSGTIGCEQHPFAKRDMDAATYAFNNIDSLQMDMAQGHGEYLQAFARTLGCSDNAIDALGAAAQKNFKSLTDKASAMQMFKNVKSMITNDRALAIGCGVSA